MSFRYSRPLISSGLGCELIFFSFATGASDSVVRDGAGNTIASVTRTAAGKYTVQLNKPYAKQLVACSQPAVRQPAGTINQVVANIPSDTGYDADAGQVLVELSDDVGIVDPAAGSRVEFVGIFRTFGATLVEA